MPRTVKKSAKSSPSLKKTFEQYRKIKAINWSTLKLMHRSPLHFIDRVENDLDDTVGFAKGRGVHTAVLEPERFLLDYVLFEGKTRQGGAWDEFVEANPGKTILKRSEYDNIWQAADRVRRNDDVRAMMRNGTAEESFAWKDKTTGIKCKCRVDWTGESQFDLKSTGDVDDRKFGNIAARLLYYGQSSMYRDGSNHKGPVFNVAVEMTRPWDVAVYRLEDDVLLAGQELYQGLLVRVAECQKTGKWPGRYPKPLALVLPKYVFDEDQEDGTFEVVEAL